MQLDFYMISVYLVHNIMPIKNSIQVIPMNQILTLIRKFVINMGKFIVNDHRIDQKYILF
jgi:hypothetical protein